MDQARSGVEEKAKGGKLGKARRLLGSIREEVWKCNTVDS